MLSRANWGRRLLSPVGLLAPPCIGNDPDENHDPIRGHRKSRRYHLERPTRDRIRAAGMTEISMMMMSGRNSIIRRCARAACSRVSVALRGVMVSRGEIFCGPPQVEWQCTLMNRLIHNWCVPRSEDPAGRTLTRPQTASGGFIALFAAC
jgi:hypothetical protein